MVTVTGRGADEGPDRMETGMLTLKILYSDGTEWVGGVERVAECGVACTGGDNAESDAPQSPRGAHDVTDSIIGLFPGPSSKWRGTIHVRSYPCNQWLKALVVDFANGNEATYIVPTGDTYLVGPDGATIDRI